MRVPEEPIVSCGELMDRLVQYLQRRAAPEDVYRLAANHLLDLSQVYQLLMGAFDGDAYVSLLDRAIMAKHILKEFAADPNYDEPFNLTIKED